MQAFSTSWRVTECTQVLTPVEPQVMYKKFGGSRQRCQRCDIPLGVYDCPNPKCQEQHGEHIGNMCNWCYEQQERLASDALMPLSDTLCPAVASIL